MPFTAQLFLVQPNNLLTLLHGGFISWCRTLWLKFLNFLKFPLAYFSMTPLNSSPTLQAFSSSLSPALWNITWDLAEGVFSPVKHIVNEDMEHHCPMTPEEKHHII